MVGGRGTWLLNASPSACYSRAFYSVSRGFVSISSSTRTGVGVLLNGHQMLTDRSVRVSHPREATCQCEGKFVVVKIMVLASSSYLMGRLQPVLQRFEKGAKTIFPFMRMQWPVRSRR